MNVEQLQQEKERIQKTIKDGLGLFRDARRNLGLRRRGMKVKKVDAYECPVCKKMYEELGDASSCCDPRRAKAWRCENCFAVHSNKADAETCCQGVE